MNQSLSYDYDLTERNTLGLRARSQFAYSVHEEHQLEGLFAVAERKRLPVRVLGEGSNVVLTERYPGITALVSSRGKRLTVGENGEVFVDADAGENWHELVAYTVNERLWGLENLAGIPGTVGAAPVQNIGAYGVELSDRLVSLRAYDRMTRSFVELHRSACRFAYRRSLLKEQTGRYIVTRVRLSLSQIPNPVLAYRGLHDIQHRDDPAVVMQKVLHLRAAKLPDWRNLGNAGSFFHNPIVSVGVGTDFVGQNPTAPAFIQTNGEVKISAAWLIEQAGLKGFRHDRVGISDQHSLVLVNYGGATCSDVLRMAEHVVLTVKEHFGLTLRREPDLL